MRNTLLIILLLTTVFAAHSSPAAAGHARDLQRDQARFVMEYVFRADNVGALSAIDSLSAAGASGPFFLIIKARILQEKVPMDDASTDRGRKLSEDALDTLDRAIELCDRALEEDETQSQYLLYRGWAWMQKSYVRSMTRNLWTAGREAGRGKKDLERYLELHPDDADAKGMMGSFLYFADIIPGAFKFIGKLLRLPSGDRELGLEYLNDCLESDAILRTDFDLVLHNVYFYFEGRYEDALSGLERVHARYPSYPRTSMPFAIVKPYAPWMAASHDSIVARTFNHASHVTLDEVDSGSLLLVSMFQSYGDWFCNPGPQVKKRLERIIVENPAHPDWLPHYSRFVLGQWHASRGRYEEARHLWKEVKSSSGLYDKEVRVMLRDLDEYADRMPPASTLPPDEWVQRLYAEPGNAAELREFFALKRESFIGRFYAAEAALLAGAFEDAFREYESLTMESSPMWLDPYKMIAAARMAEIHAHLGEYDAAAKKMDDALDYYQKGYLIDWVLEGRQKYFHRLADGDETRHATFFSRFITSSRNR